MRIGKTRFGKGGNHAIRDVNDAANQQRRRLPLPVQRRHPDRPGHQRHTASIALRYDPYGTATAIRGGIDNGGWTDNGARVYRRRQPTRQIVAG